MMKHMMNILLTTVFLGLLYVLVPFAWEYGSTKKFDAKVAESQIEVVQDMNLLYTGFSHPIINHCDVTISVFLTRDNVEVALPVLFIPIDHAKLSYKTDEPTLLSWNIPMGTPPGIYLMNTHVKNDCGMLSGNSIKLMTTKVEIQSW